MHECHNLSELRDGLSEVAVNKVGSQQRTRRPYLSKFG